MNNKQADTVDSRREYLRGRVLLINSEPRFLHDLFLYFGDSLANAEEDDYHGSGVALFKCRPEDPFYAIVHYSWGSCSGCCAFSACHTLEDFRELLGEYAKDAVIFNTRDEILHYLKDRDWCALDGLDYSVGKEFEKRVLNLVDL